MYLGAMHELPREANVLRTAGTQQGLHKDLRRRMFNPVKGLKNGAVEGRTSSSQMRLFRRVAVVSYLVTRLSLQTGVHVLLHVEQILQ